MESQPKSNMTGELLQRYLNGVTNSAENKEVLDWAEDDVANRNDLNILRRLYDAILCYSDSFGLNDTEQSISETQIISPGFNIEDSAQVAGNIALE